MAEEGRLYISQKMPSIGFGTYQLYDEKVLEEALDTALATGYRLIDCAQLYENEAMIGEILTKLLPKHKLKREDIFLTSKLHPSFHGEDLTAEAIEQCLDDLETDYLDLLLLHWPGVCKMPATYVHNPRLRHESYRVMEKYYKRGEIRAIGVSNFEPRHIELLERECTIKPAVNQIEVHPHFLQLETRDYCQKNNIAIQAYSSLGSDSYKTVLMEDPAIKSIAAEYQTPPSTILLSWALTQGMAVIPRSTNPEHITDNYKAKDVVLKPSDVDRLNNIGINNKVCWDSSIII